MLTNLRFSLFFMFLLQASSVALKHPIITPRESLRDGDTLVSADQVFELGFFSPGEIRSSAKHRFLVVRYKQPLSRAIIWVANRENPLVDLPGVLNLSSQGDMRLFDWKNNVLWSSKASRPAKNPVLKLLSSGNLVLSDVNEDVLWQSFDYPVDTLLAGMKLGKNLLTRKEWSLTSWKSPKDPSIGEFSLLIDTSGLPQLIMKNRDRNYYRLGSWNGVTFSGTPDIRQANDIFNYSFLSSAQQVTYSWEPRHQTVSRLVLTSSGFLQRFILRDGWLPVYSAPRDPCDRYSFCGAYATCSVNNNAANCSCLQGFKPKSPWEWNLSNRTNGCVRETKTQCRKGEWFVKYSGLKLPDTSASWYDAGMSLEECKKRCLKNCSCTAYANTDIRGGGNGCVLWFGDLVDLRVYSDNGQDVYIRMADAKKTGRSGGTGKNVGVIVGSVMAVGVVLVAFIVCCTRRRLKSDNEETGNIWRKEVGQDDMDLPIFDMNTIRRATDDFSHSNFIGQGGFGPVYKGKLEEGQEIAVKRLSSNSGQGIQEFVNEVKLIAKLQHRNLVRLLGCCIQGDERMLVYEYMQNKSLDFFIFDKTRRKLLDWQKRMNIIGGIARGLLYLHQDSRLRIIHRDLKAGNILLDSDMNPKISDFGLAKSFGGDQIEANTNKVVGTYGYMSPEYAVDGHFSVKSDVFSFGVLVLEIVIGKKNRGFRHSSHDLNLLGHAWKAWLEDRALELAEEVFLGEACVVSEVLRCVHVGLLCVQQKPEDRPNMASVVLMLASDGSLPQPKQPGFFTGRNAPEVSSSLSEPSVSEVSITMSLDGR